MRRSQIDELKSSMYLVVSGYGLLFSPHRFSGVRSIVAETINTAGCIPILRSVLSIYVGHALTRVHGLSSQDWPACRSSTYAI
jgi:hypothetical protein